MFEISGKFREFSLFQEVRANWGAAFRFVIQFFASPYSSQITKSFFGKIQTVLPIKDLIYPESVLNEVIEDSETPILQSVGLKSPSKHSIKPN